jgi:hypothetical protein
LILPAAPELPLQVLEEDLSPDWPGMNFYPDTAFPASSQKPAGLEFGFFQQISLYYALKH